ncbi:hypothetical protein LOD99_14088 [Oopsacas minuta]|uniref:Eukaryotic translation initiation factor 3 30 kDa subunit n=1 Tax=Oopsacas minuta TaxID=111878 RepID=A0AAV7KIW2_9METZ|nr:hypothetical protein LOD99_14088 [Oopsacas minuta]
MASWDDDNYDLDVGFVNKLDKDSKIAAPDSSKETQKESKKQKQKNEIERKRELAEVEDFMGVDDTPDDVINSKPVTQPVPAPINARAQLKASLREASTIDDIMRISSELADIINSARESDHYVKLLIELIRKCAKDLPPDDIRQLAANLNSLHKSQDKKKKGKRPNLKLAPGKKGDDRAVSNAYDEFNLDDNRQDVDSGDEQYYKKHNASGDEDKWNF